MAFSLKNIIFTTKFWTRTDIDTDPNKDGADKGTLQRYNESLGEDYDDELQPLIENLVANNLDPDTALIKFLVYLECLFLPVILGTDEAMRRRVIKYTSHFNRVRGTVVGYEIMFSMLGMDTVIVEDWEDFSFDSGTPFDTDGRTFDTVCYGCSPYCLVLTSKGAPIIVTQEILEAIFNVVEYNEPVNAKLQKLELDGACLVQEILSVLVLDNGDLTYNNQFDLLTSLFVDADGDIFVDGLNELKYTLSPDGDLLYNC